MRQLVARYERINAAHPIKVRGGVVRKQKQAFPHIPSAVHRDVSVAVELTATSPHRASGSSLLATFSLSGAGTTRLR